MDDLAMDGGPDPSPDDEGHPAPSEDVHSTEFGQSRALDHCYYDIDPDAVPVTTEPCSDEDYLLGDAISAVVTQDVNTSRGDVSMYVQKITRGDLVVGDKITQHVRYDRLVKNVYRHSAGYEQVKDQSRADLKSQDGVFVETRLYREAVMLLQQHGVLIIIGPPGSGKTTLAKALLRHFESHSYTPLILHRHAEWRQYVGGKDNMVVMLDNVFGEVCVDQKKFTKWSLSFTCMCQFAAESKCRTVFTMCTHIHREIELSGKHRQFIKNVPVLDLGGTASVYTAEEKCDMLRRHHAVKGESISDSEIEELLSGDTSGPVFPWCVARLTELSSGRGVMTNVRRSTAPDAVPTNVCALDVESNAGPLTSCGSKHWRPVRLDSASSIGEPCRVFRVPEMAYVSFFLKALSDKEHGHIVEAVLRLAFKMDGRACSRPRAMEELTALGHASSYAQQLQHVHRHFNEAYFSPRHERERSLFLRDVAVLTLGAYDLPAFLEMCSLKCLVQHVHTEDVDARISVRVQRESPAYEILHRKLHDEVVSGNIPGAVQHPSFESSEYLSDFTDYLARNDKLGAFLSAGDSEHGETILYWSVFSSSFVLMQWCVRQMLEQKTDDSQIRNCLLRVFFLCAVCDGTELSDSVRSIAASLRKVSNLSDPIAEVNVYLPPSREQQYTPSVMTKCQKFTEKIHSGALFYLDDPAMPIPASVLHVEIIENCARLVFPTKQWYLALRLASDRQVDERDEDGNTSLHVAVHTGHLDAIKTAVRSGASLTVPNRDQQTPVQLAVKARHARDTTSGTVTTPALRADDSRSWPAHGRTLANFSRRRTEDLCAVRQPGLQVATSVRAFHGLCANGDLESVKVWLCRDASMEDTDASGQTALYVASQAGHTHVARLLIQLGACVRAKTKEGTTPLHAACHQGQTDVAELLIDHGAIVNLPDFSGSTPLHVACVSGSVDVISLLLRHGAKVNTKNHDKFAPLHLATRRGHRNAAELLLRYAANVNSQNCYASTPLHYACSDGYYDMAALLLEKGADLSKCTSRGSTPLHLACQEGHTQIVGLLVSRGADVNAKNTSRSTPLHAACFFQRRDTAAFLLQHNADPGKRNRDGYTPLHLACERGDRQTAELLIQHGVDVQASNKSGFTSLHYAAFFGHLTTAELLLQHHADVAAFTRPNRCTPLSLACQRGHRPIVELLIRHNADVNCRDRAGYRPLDRARQNAHKETCALLTKNGAKAGMKFLSLKHKTESKSAWGSCQSYSDQL